jgi:hypothetical protein
MCEDVLEALKHLLLPGCQQQDVRTLYFKSLKVIPRILELKIVL